MGNQDTKRPDSGVNHNSVVSNPNHNTIGKVSSQEFDYSVLIIVGVIILVFIGLFCLYSYNPCLAKASSVTPASSEHSDLGDDWLDRIPDSSEEGFDTASVPTIIIVSAPTTPRWLQVPDH